MIKKSLKKLAWLKIIGGVIGTTTILAGVSAIAVSCSATGPKPGDPVDVNGTILNNNSQDFMSYKSKGSASSDVIKENILSINTPQMMKEVFATSSGQTALVNNYANYAVYEWFKNSLNPVVSGIYEQQLTDAQNKYKTKYDSYKTQGSGWENKFQQQVLDPAGGTKQSWIYNTLVSNLSTQFISLVFPTNYLQSYLNFQQGSGSSQTYTPIFGSSLTMAEIDKSSNVLSTGTPSGTIVISASNPNATGSTSVDIGYADFINFVFNQWVKQDMPILTPALLYKNQADPNTSGLFNTNFFNSSALNSDASYNFQYFAPSSDNYQDLSTTDIYNIFRTGLTTGSNNSSAASLENNTYVNPNLGGSIDLPKDLTQDSSTKLITNVSNAYTTYVTPFTAAAMYKFNNMIFGTTSNPEIDANMPSENVLNPDGIMNNFIVTSATTNASTGTFMFPYSLTNKSGQSAFSGAYNGMIGIRDTINLNNSPFILTRDQFGVHIIGIDRFQAMKTAADKAPTPLEKLNAVENVMGNTVLWRSAQDMLSQSQNSNSTLNNIDLQTTLKKFASDNISKLIIAYLSQSNVSTNKQNLFTSSEWEKTPVSLTTNEISLFNSISQLGILQTDETYIDTIKSKMYALQKTYNTNTNPNQWSNNGIAAVLPYTRNTVTGGFDSLEKTVLGFLPDVPTSDQAQIPDANQPIGKLWYALKLARTNFAVALNTFLANVKPAGSNSDYWTKASWFSNETPTVIGKHSYVFTDNLLVNLAVQQAQSSSVVSNVSQNALTNAQLYNFYNFSTNELFYPEGNKNITSLNNVTTLQDLNSFIVYSMQKAINSQYNLSKFTSLESLYQNGDWSKLATDNTALATTNEQALTSIQAGIAKANNLSFNNNRLFVNSSGAEQPGSNAENLPNAQHLNLTSLTNFKTFLETLQWLVGWNGKTYTFSNLITQLNSMTANNQNAYIAWMLEVSLKGNNPNTYLTGAVPGSTYKDYSTAINTTIQNAGAFKQNPLYLTNISPYSFQGATALYKAYLQNSASNSWSDFNQAQTSWSTASSYWNMAQVGTNASSTTGFLGFQANNVDTVSSLLPSSAYQQSIFANNTSNSNYNYTGSLYQFGSFNNFKDLITNASSSSQLDGYLNIIKNTGFSLTNEIATKLTDAINGNHTLNGQIEPLSFSERKQNTLDVLNAIETTYPQAFNPLTNTFLWNQPAQSASTTLFNSSQAGLKNEYVVTQFNADDVKNLVTEFKGTQDIALNTIILAPNETTGARRAQGFLGLQNAQTFFDSIILLAMNSNLQSQVKQSIQNNQQEPDNKITVYDYNVAKALGENVVSDWKEFENSNN